MTNLRSRESVDNNNESTSSHFLESQSLERLRRLIYLLSFVISLHIIMNLYSGSADDDWAGSSIAPMHAMLLESSLSDT